jgi:hypothetical protein
MVFLPTVAFASPHSADLHVYSHISLLYMKRLFIHNKIDADIRGVYIMLMYWCKITPQRQPLINRPGSSWATVRPPDSIGVRLSDISLRDE